MDLPVYFISDAHLAVHKSKEEDQKQEKLTRFFRHVSRTGGTLYVLGDLFDFYFEYPHVIPKMYFQIYHELYTLKRAGVSLHYMLGNHDYWIQDFISGQLFDTIYKEDSIQDIHGKKFYLTHGDGIISWDIGYRILKARSEILFSSGYTDGYTLQSDLDSRTGFRKKVSTMNILINIMKKS